MTPFLIKEDNDGHQQGKTFSRYSARDKSGQLLCSSMRISSQGIKEMYSAECFVVVKNLTVPISSYAFLMNFYLLPANIMAIKCRTCSDVKGTSYVAKRSG